MQTNSWVPIFPEQASTFAWQVDTLYFYLIFISAFFTIGIAAAVFFFFVKYREKEKYATGAEIHGSIALETIWSIIPFVISMTIFLGGAVVYYNQYRPPADSMEIYVVGKQWMWKFQHGTGQREINELHVPIGRNVKLTMTTEDVLHDVYIPAFRTKADVIPGRYTTIWFNATKPGKYHLYCAEYCGLNHSGMGGWVYVMEQRDFDNWLSGNTSGQTPVQAGQDHGIELQPFRLVHGEDLDTLVRLHIGLGEKLLELFPKHIEIGKLRASGVGFEQFEVGVRIFEIGFGANAGRPAQRHPGILHPAPEWDSSSIGNGGSGGSR